MENLRTDQPSTSGGERLIPDLTTEERFVIDVIAVIRIAKFLVELRSIVLMQFRSQPVGELRSFLWCWLWSIGGRHGSEEELILRPVQQFQTRVQFQLRNIVEPHITFGRFAAVAFDAPVL